MRILDGTPDEIAIFLAKEKKETMPQHSIVTLPEKKNPKLESLVAMYCTKMPEWKNGRMAFYFKPEVINDEKLYAIVSWKIKKEFPKAMEHYHKVRRRQSANRKKRTQLS